MQVAHIAVAAFLFFLGAIGLFAGFSLLTGENDDLTDTGERVVGALWLLSALLYAVGGALVLRRPPARRNLLIVLAVLVLGAVLITVNPYFGAPLTAAAVLVAILGLAR